MRLEPEIDCRIWNGAGDAVDIRGAGEGVDAGAGEMAGVVEGDGGPLRYGSCAVLVLATLLSCPLAARSGLSV